MDGGAGGGGGGGGARARGGGSITRGGKVALVTRDGSSIRSSRKATRSGNSVRGIYIQEPDFGSSNRGGSGTRRGIDTRRIHIPEPDSGSGTRGGSATRGGSSTYGTYVQESDSGSATHATFERQGSEDSSYKCKGKKTVAEGKRQTCGKYTILRGGKTRGLAGSHSRMGRGDEMADLDGVLRNIRIHDIYADEDECDYEKDDDSHEGDVNETDGGENVDFQDGSLEDTGGKGDGGKDDGGNRPWIKRCEKKPGGDGTHETSNTSMMDSLTCWRVVIETNGHV